MPMEAEADGQSAKCREWKKLTAGEKQRALDNIDEYYDHLNNQKYCKQAATYLADKSFENEYDD